MDLALEPLGVGLTHVAALMHLNLQPGLSGAELARRMLITPQSTATLLGNLEARGWVERTPHPIHRTLVETKLTSAGRAILEVGEAKIIETDRAISAGLSQAERKILEQGLDACLANARAIAERARAKPTR